MRYSVLDRGWIELQDMMGDDLAVVNAARVSFLGESKGKTADKKLLFYLMRHRHTSPFEQVEFKFRAHAPLVVWWQWVRHRTANLNMSSGRYIEFEPEEFYVPKVWRKQSNDNKQGSEGQLSEGECEVFTHKLLSHILDSYDLYQEALVKGIAKEQARLFLPAFSLYYTGVWKIDAHNLMHFLSLRMAEGAQWEIREYANVIFEIFKEKMPWTAEAFTNE